MDDAVSLLPFRMHSFLKSTLCCVHAAFLMLFFPHIYPLCVCLLMCVSACIYWGMQKSEVRYFLWSLCTLLRQGLSLNLEIIDLTRPAGQQVPDILSLSLQLLSLRHTLSQLALYLCSWDPNLGPHIYMELYWLTHLPEPSQYIFSEISV